MELPGHSTELGINVLMLATWDAPFSMADIPDELAEHQGTQNVTKLPAAMFK